MKIDSIKGESVIQGHRDEIDISGFSMGVDRPLVQYLKEATNSGAPQFYEVRVTKKIDATSPLLFSACAIGDTFPTVVLSLSRIDSKGAAGSKKSFDFFVVTLSNVTITRVATGGSEESDALATQDEQLSLSFQKIEWTHRTDDGKGKPKVVTKSFDLGTLMQSAPAK